MVCLSNFNFTQYKQDGYAIGCIGNYHVSFCYYLNYILLLL